VALDGRPRVALDDGDASQWIEVRAVPEGDLLAFLESKLLEGVSQARDHLRADATLVDDATRLTRVDCARPTTGAASRPAANTPMRAFNLAGRLTPREPPA
jgi:hypothetical protein